MAIKSSKSNRKISSGFKRQVTGRDRISRKQLTEGLKSSLGAGKRMRTASSLLKKENESLFKRSSYSRQQLTKRLQTLKEAGFLRSNISVKSASRNIHTNSVARSMMEKAVAKNLDERKKSYRRDERKEVDAEERRIKRNQIEREDKRKQKRAHNAERQEEVVQSRLSRAAAKRTQLGLGEDIATRRIKGSMKTDKNTILAKIRNEKTTSEAPEGPLSQIKEQPGKGDIGAPGGSNEVGGGGWSAPPTTSKKGL